MGNQTNAPFMGYSNVVKKRTSEIDIASNYGKQQNIISNLRSELTNLKQEVSKLMHKEPNNSDLEKSRISSNVTSGNMSMPFNSIVRTESMDHNRPREPQMRTDERWHVEKIAADNEKLGLDLKNAFAR